MPRPAGTTNADAPSESVASEHNPDEVGENNRAARFGLAGPRCSDGPARCHRHAVVETTGTGEGVSVIEATNPVSVRNRVCDFLLLLQAPSAPSSWPEHLPWEEEHERAKMLWRQRGPLPPEKPL